MRQHDNDREEPPSGQRYEKRIVLFVSGGLTLAESKGAFGGQIARRPIEAIWEALYAQSECALSM
jgi:hypothetical protein